ncbi:hypothetical protein CTEN210_03322 [Chaetoceros tenuissimus]|uniref:Glycosyl transferase 64 domain-containing protein n=1 Tax=Chaetoceros tenuissimus TaxID=426638 RepID=A0AAD3H1N6_9STRA|nr:hypothetical protein CTEN210_03322 [Chaetoceros tenuissimus]
MQRRRFPRLSGKIQSPSISSNNTTEKSTIKTVNRSYYTKYNTIILIFVSCIILAILFYEHEVISKPKSVVSPPKSIEKKENKTSPSGFKKTTASAIDSYGNEENVFKQVMKRSEHFQSHCKALPEHHLGEAKPKDFDTGVDPLPEHGVHEAMQNWLDGDAKNRGEVNYPICSLPPVKECDVDQFTLILMSHTVEEDDRLKKLRSGISNLSVWSNTGEIILVWNNDRSVLEDCQKEHCQRIVQWDKDPSHKLRIFYALENGMTNNLLNRYHPSLEPKHEAIVYFDDDGPFHSELAMEVGFELWKYNSDVQIASMARNIRYPSTRMDDLQNKASDVASELYHKDDWRTHTHPYDTKTIENNLKFEGRGKIEDTGYPQFTPICHEETGDVVEYNYYVWPNFKAHMNIPSGSILHRNYLCFMWHPAFEELREYILRHPTHPDDMTMSTLVSHLSGKPLRTFPRKIKDEGKIWKKKEPGHRRLGEVVSSSSEEEISDSSPSTSSEEPRRRLLWQHKDWGNMREEAINSIVGYFGSVNPGSVGWCVGTEYQQEATGKGNMRFECKKEKFPDISEIPWMNAGGLGYDECPR